MNVEGYLDIRVWMVRVVNGILIGRVLCSVHRSIGDLREWLIDRLEERIHVGLNPSAGEFDDRDAAAAGQVGWPIVGVTKIGNLPGEGRGVRRRPASIGLKYGTLELRPVTDVRMVDHDYDLAVLKRDGSSTTHTTRH